MPAAPSRRAARRRLRAADWGAIRLFAMDVDGVLTDGTVLVSSDGTEAKAFSILDGYGLRELARAGIVTAWISGRPSAATSRRAAELEIPHLVMGRNDKLAVLRDLARDLALEPAHCAYMGDDVIDVPALAWAGIGIAPPDAVGAALAAAAWVTRRRGGHGAVRDVCDRLLERSPTRTGTQTRSHRSKERPSA